MVSPRQSQRVGQQLGDVPYRQGIVLGRQAVFQHGQAERAGGGHGVRTGVARLLGAQEDVYKRQG